MNRNDRLAIVAGCLLICGASWAKTLKVVATTPDLASLVREVGGERTQVETLASPFQNPHFVDAKPSLILKVMKADLFVETGMDLEVGWAPLLIQSSGNRKVQPGSPGFLDCSEAITPLEVPAKPDRSMGDVHPQGNPHYLLDPENAGPVARKIVEELSTLSPGDSEYFKKNRAAFEARLSGNVSVWKASLKPYQGTKFVSYHKIYPYFARRFGFEEAGEIEPKPGIPPTASHTSELINLMKAEKVKLILTEPWHEKRTPASIAKETGAKVVVMEIFPGSSPESTDYITTMDRNVKRLVGALFER